jgi:hypothetical protein
MESREKLLGDSLPTQETCRDLESSPHSGHKMVFNKIQTLRDLGIKLSKLARTFHSRSKATISLLEGCSYSSLKCFNETFVWAID